MTGSCLFIYKYIATDSIFKPHLMGTSKLMAPFNIFNISIKLYDMIWYDIIKQKWYDTSFIS